MSLGLKLKSWLDWLAGIKTFIETEVFWVNSASINPRGLMLVVILNDLLDELSGVAYPEGTENRAYVSVHKHKNKLKKFGITDLKSFSRVMGLAS